MKLSSRSVFVAAGLVLAACGGGSLSLIHI